MSSDKEDDDSPKSEATSSKSEDQAASEAAQKQAAKRRTKTGCLTCRKRRIKCGEEKPICKNCIKSKRDCAGYVQPLVYKQQNQGPQSDIRDPAGRSYSTHEDAFSPAYLHNPLQPGQQFLGTYPTISPPGVLPYQQMQPGHYAQHTQMAPPGAVYQLHTGAGNYFEGQPSHFQPAPLYQTIDPTGRVSTPIFQIPYQDQTAFSQVPLDPARINPSNYSESRTLSQDHTSLSAMNPSPQEFSQQRHFSESIHHRSGFMPQPYGVLQADLEENDSRRYSVHGFVQHPTITSTQSGPIATGPMIEQQHYNDDYEDPDDPYDVDMEEQDIPLQDAAQNLTEILDRSGRGSWQQPRRQVSRRSQQQTVATFKPTLTLSPLQDERNERIFCHFVEVSSHCMSIYERHHFSPISAPARTLWNFTIPALALSHAALAHAILALGALHLAKLQNTSEDLAVKHFTYSVRRVGKLLGLPRRRHEIATLATVLVLGFYEVVTGDHSRWNLHLRGATKLVLEHDFASLIKIARRMRSGAKARVNQWTAQFALTEENYGRVAGIPLALLDDVDWEVNTDLVSQLTGVHIDYDQQFQPHLPRQELLMNLSDKDVEDLKAKMDLRWWYCKQDIFQSMISGDRLLMPYEQWIYCPPRGQIGRADNPYATLDHFMLVMARLADFGGKDRPRKQRAVKIQGGQWKPPVWLFGPQGPPGPPGPPQAGPKSGSGPPSQPATARSARSSSSTSTKLEGGSAAKPSPAPSANEGRVRQSKPGGALPSAGNTPPMYGMMPPSAEIHVHSAFKGMNASINDPAFQPAREERQPTPTTSFEEDTAQAFAEHAQIVAAFDVLKAALGADFEPLPQSGTQPLTTPFGPALIYRNAGVACIWLFYHVARILLWRFHPEMPPAAMVSAGVTAHLTKDHAQAVGKICAGLYSSQHYGQTGALDPSFAGALMESTFQLLFAAVQFQDAAQRGWTIIKLQDVARRCGWQTSGAVAAACEIAWERMGQAGRGPPYDRTLDHKNKDARVSGAHSRSDRTPGGSSQGTNPVAEYESEFVNHDRSLIDRSNSTRTHWALGLLSVEEDIKKMSIGED